MSGLDQAIFYALVMLVVGLGIPIIAALNGGLATRLQNPMLASTVALCAVFEFTKHSIVPGYGRLLLIAGNSA